MVAPALGSLRLSRPVALVTALLLAALAALATASPARAHDELLGSDPAAKSTVDALPAQLRLTFSGVIASEDGASEVQVTDASGATLTDGAPTAQDNVLTQPLAGEASGTVTVLWKVVSSDGHPISGEFSFTVEDAPAPTPTETASPTPDDSPAPTAVAPVATATPPADATPADGSSVLPWLIAGVLALALAGAVVYLLASRARRERALAREAASPADGASRPGSEPPADQ